ncbi:8987_t:CDS:2, partial [Funneliformis caledonium]
VAITKASCLSFSFTFTEQIYKELEETLRIEHNRLLKGFQSFNTDPLLQPILSDWYMTQNIQKEDTIIISTNISSHDDKIINIKARKRLSGDEIYKLALPVQLDGNLQFTHDTISAYDIYMQKKVALIHRRVEFYKQISYTLIDNDGKFNMDLDIHAGDIVQMQEENDISYAIIKALFTHKYNDGLVYAFIWVDWLRKSLILDPILQCPVYEVQMANNTQWYQVYLITLIDNLPKNHFVRRCHSTCIASSHDLSNNQYFKNEFYYTTI